MKSPKILFVSFALALVVAMGCSSAMKMFNDNPLTNSLMSQIPGLNQLQAVGGAGALLGLAQGKLPAADFSKLTSLVPNVDQMIGQAKKAGGLPASLNSLADLGSTFSKLGISPDQASKLVPATTKFFTEKGGAEVGNMLAGVLK
jgi:hypothetical protein